MIDYVGGVEEIREMVYSKWVSESAAIIGYVPEMRFQGVEKTDTPSKDKYWGRLSVISFTDQQATLSTESVVSYTRRYRDNGRVVMQLFAPRYGDNSGKKLLQLAQIVQNTLRGTRTPSGIWFRNAQIDASLSPEENFQRVNVFCDYERDEII